MNNATPCMALNGLSPFSPDGGFSQPGIDINPNVHERAAYRFDGVMTPEDEVYLKQSLADVYRGPGIGSCFIDAIGGPEAVNAAITELGQLPGQREATTPVDMADFEPGR